MTAVGRPLTRLDGRLKVTDGARYAGDIPLSGTVHGAIVHSTIANGRMTSLDTTAAERAPGVLAVSTYRNMRRFNPTPKPWSHLHPHGQGYLPMQDDSIYYNGQPVAVVVAETRDQAAYAGTLLEAIYDATPPSVFGPDSSKDAVDPPQFLWPVNSKVGDAAKAIADSAVKIQGTYWTPDRHHMQMEPHATLAAWDDQGILTLFDATQHVSGTRELFSMLLGMPAEKIEVVSRFVGGGFGGKAYVWPHQLLAATAAKHVRRPVRIQLTRAQMFSMVGHQSATVQTISLGETSKASSKASSTTASRPHRCSTTTSSTRRIRRGRCGLRAAGLPQGTRWFTSTATRPRRCGRRTKPWVMSRSKARWMNLPTRRAWTRCNCGYSTTHRWTV